MRKRPAKAKAQMINAFVLAGRFVVGDTYTQSAALGYVFLPFRVGVHATLGFTPFVFYSFIPNRSLVSRMSLRIDINNGGKEIRYITRRFYVRS